MQSFIFISYSWSDEIWRREIASQLEGVIKHSAPDWRVWVDEDRLRTGERIDDAVKDGIDHTRVAVLLISPGFLNSSYIREHELPLLRNRAIQLFPILVEPCRWQDIGWLSERLLLGARDRHNELMALSMTRRLPDERISAEARQILADAAGKIIQIMSSEPSADAGPREQEVDRPHEGPNPLRVHTPGDKSPEPDADAYVEIELALQHRDTHYYQAELRLTQSNDDNERYPHFVRLDTGALGDRAANTRDYGQALTDAVFPKRGARPDLILEKGMSRAKGLGVPLRLRICISPTAMELHAVHWESLINPLSPTGAWLLDPTADEGRWPRIAFSRHALGSDQRWREVQLRSKPREQARALVAVAAPSEASLRLLSSGRLRPIDRDEQERRARANLNLQGIAVEVLSETAPHMTDYELIDALEDEQGWDLLYLVCHCTMDDHRPALVLEDRRGEAQPIAARDLVERMWDLRIPPRGLILVTGGCSDPDDARYGPERIGLLKTGPLLLQSGIVLTLMCDGSAAPDQLDETLPRVFEHLPNNSLGSDGRADEALAWAQAQILPQYHSDPWWRPVLVSRQKTTRLWYSPGFLKAEQSEENWRRLMEEIDKGQCTPIIGPGLVQHLVGSRREMAQSWADDHFFPMSYHDRINLPQVAQYLLVNHDGQELDTLPPECAGVEPQMRTLCGELSNNLRSYIRTRYRHQMPRKTNDWPLSRVFSCAGRKEIERNVSEPHRILAALELPLYVTANQNLLLEDALCRHDPELKASWDALDEDKTQPFEYPEKVRERIHHVFGDMDHIQDVVVTEDDYFEFLLSALREDEKIPYRVQSRLSSTSLLFLGFRLYHWDFRVLFQFIKALGGSALLQGRPHVAVQIDPDDDYIVDPERARRYLESYFADDETDTSEKGRKPGFQISIYWGTPVDFLRSLQEHRAPGTGGKTAVGANFAGIEPASDANRDDRQDGDDPTAVRAELS